MVQITPTVFKAVIKAKDGYFEESKISKSLELLPTCRSASVKEKIMGLQ